MPRIVLCHSGAGAGSVDGSPDAGSPLRPRPGDRRRVLGPEPVGFDHTAIAIGLMPVFLVAAEARLRVAGREPAAARRWTVIAAIAGLLVSWLHPWQGVTLLGVLGGLAVVKAPRRRYFALTVPVLATLLPLLYGFVLSYARPGLGRFPVAHDRHGNGSLVGADRLVGPLALLGVIGLRRPHEDRDWMLVLWVLASRCVLRVPGVPVHALSGVTLPLPAGRPRLAASAAHRQGRAADRDGGNPGVHRSGGDLPRTGRARRVPSLDRRRRRRASVDDPHARPGAGDVLPRAGAAAGRGSGPLVPLDVGAGAHPPSGLRRARHVAAGLAGRGGQPVLLTQPQRSGRRRTPGDLARQQRRVRDRRLRRTPRWVARSPRSPRWSGASAA